MNKKECENQILEKLKEIKKILRQYDKSKELYLTMTITEDCIVMNNAYWETETPLGVTLFDDGGVIHYVD